MENDGKGLQECVDWLVKVKDYFQAKDVGKEPSTEVKDAFERRKLRHLDQRCPDKLQGLFIDYSDPSNIRKEALEDLEYCEVHLDQCIMVLDDKILGKENFTGLDAKANFYKRLDEVFAEDRTKHKEYYKDEPQRKMVHMEL